jgi:hypothetical protein
VIGPLEHSSKVRGEVNITGLGCCFRAAD